MSGIQEYNETLSPGLLIQSKTAGAPGTLGCFARLKTDPSKIFVVSAGHILYGAIRDVAPSPTAGNGSDVGQPSVSCCLSCACRVVAENTDTSTDWSSVAITSPVNQTATGSRYDIAMAEWNGERAYTNQGQYGMITGAPSGGLGVQAGDAVEFVGSTSGHVTGTVIGLAHSSTHGGQAVSNLLFPDRLAGSAEERFMTSNVRTVLQLLILPDADPSDGTIRMMFGQRGDSGAAVVNSQKQVIGILSQVWQIPDLAHTDLNNYLPNAPLPPHALGIGIVSPIGPALDDFGLEIVNNMSGTATASAVVDINGRSREREERVAAQLVLQDLEREIRTKALGIQALDALERHRSEVIGLVNDNRRVAVTWHRNKGPAFAAHCLHNLSDRTYVVPKSVDGVTAVDLLRKMALILKRYGSPELQNDIRRFESMVYAWVEDCQNIWSLVERMRRLPAAEPQQVLAG